MFRVLLTGGSGFLGTALLKNKAFDGALVVGRTQPPGWNNFVLRSLDPSTDFTDLFKGVDVVVHTAARAHVMDENASDSVGLYRDINTLTTLSLAEQAERSGVKRFIFISSIKVLGEKTEHGKPFLSGDMLSPEDPYAVSKAEAEIGLLKFVKNSNMDVVIIRPPLVYGPKVKGNFAKLLRLSTLEIPLPFASINNKRSLVGVENLVDLIVNCLTNTRAKNQIFLVSDDMDMSTPELLNLIANTGKYKSRLFWFPVFILKFLFLSIGRKGVYERLCGSMVVDITHTKKQLGWTPPLSTMEGVANCWIDDD